MKSIDDLRKAFFGWRQPLSRDNALRGGIETSRILDKLTDPTPITEAGLRELGFEQYFGSCVWWLGDLRFTYEDDTLRFDRREIKTMGRLRMLLLGVGE